MPCRETCSSNSSQSGCREYLDGGKGYVPFDVGDSAFRFLVPIEQLARDPLTKDLIGNPGNMTLAMGGDRKVVYYPCVNNTIMNCLLVHPSRESRSDLQGIIPGTRQNNERK